jgi:hypothetical protein
MFDALNEAWDKDNTVDDGHYTAIVESVEAQTSKGGAGGVKVTLKLTDVIGKAFIDFWLINKDGSVNGMGKNDLKQVIRLLDPAIADYKNPLTGTPDAKHSLKMFLDLAKRTPCIVEATTVTKPSPDGTREFTNQNWKVLSFENSLSADNLPF